MKSINRFLRIYYKDMDLSGLLNVFSVGDLQGKFNSDIIMTRNYFNLSDDFNIKEIIRRYLNKYDENYNEDEVNHLIEWYIDTIKSRFFITDVINSAHLFLIASDLFAINHKSKLVINFDDLLKWEGLINDTDVQILKCAYESINLKRHHQEYRSDIRHDNLRLYNILERGYSENHMHFNASGYSTEINYFNWLNYIDEYASKGKLLKLFTHDEKNENLEIVLKNEYYAQKKIQIIRAYLTTIINDSNEECLESNEQDIVKVFSNINSIFIDELFEKAVRINQNQLGFNKLKEVHDISDLENMMNMEEELIIKLFDLLLSCSLNSFDLYCVNVYLVFKTQFKFNFVQDNHGMGFSKFKRKEELKDIFISNIDKQILISSVFEKYYKEEHVKKIEIRIAPKHKREFESFSNIVTQENDNIYEKYCIKNPKTEKIKLGVIVHYIKQNYSYNHESRTNKCRLSLFREQIMEHCKITSELINSTNALESETLKIVGVDAANFEISCRPENLGVVFRRHRFEFNGSTELKFTYHVGEEYINQCNGIRAIDEAIKYLNLKRGDRLGHAIALGVDVFNFYLVKKNILFTTLQEYVDDISWMFSLLRNESTINSDSIEFLRNQYNKYISILYKNTSSTYPTIYDYCESFQLRGDNPDIYFNLDDISDDEGYYYNLISSKKYEINHTLNEHKIAFLNRDARKIYYDYHFNMKIKESGNDRLVLDTNDTYLRCVKLAQDIVKRKIARLGLVIESNPSSNRKISIAKKIDDVLPTNFNQYLLRNENDGFINLPVIINTDDSAIFQTNLVNEYSIIAKALINQNYEEERVYSYIDYLRKLSLDTSFI